jgi:hypothetical protein
MDAIAPPRGMFMRRTRDGIPVVRLHYSANPRCDEEWAKNERKKFTSQAFWDLEMEIKYEALSGARVYPEFDPSVHVIQHSKIPKLLVRSMSIDPHPRTPHAALWVGIDRWSDWYIYRELWPSIVYGQPKTLRDDTEDKHYTIREYCETIAYLEGNSLRWHAAEEDEEYAEYVQGLSGICCRCGDRVKNENPGCTEHRPPERIVERLMDQAGKGFRASGEAAQREENYADRYYRFGIQCSDPIKAVRAGEDLIHSLLKPRHHEFLGNWPRLHISDECPELILELTKLRFQKTRTLSDEKELKQDPVEQRSHMIDNLRYLAFGRLSFIAELAS